MTIHELTEKRRGGYHDTVGPYPDPVLEIEPGDTVEGGYVYLGDCHAAQGDGELCGVAIEHPTNTTITVDLIEGWNLEWPRLESDEFIMSIGSVRPMEDAARAAYTDLVGWLADDYGFDPMEAYMLLTQVGHVRLGNMVDPNYTIGAGSSKEYL